jgi:hypothetical protein
MNVDKEQLIQSEKHSVGRARSAILTLDHRREPEHQDQNFQCINFHNA